MTLRKVTDMLDDAAGVALDWLDVIGKHGTLPVTRPELMKMLKKAMRAYEKYEERED